MIILINGPSSSGKSTLIDQFIKKSNKEFIKVAFDDILYLIHKVNWSKQLLSILGENIIKNKKEFFYYNEESDDKNDLYRIKFNNSYTELLYSMHSFWKILIDNGFNIIIDHIFLYKSAQEVREHIKEAGLSIENELVQAVFEKDESDPEKEKIPVSYAAILS